MSETLLVPSKFDQDTLYDFFVKLDQLKQTNDVCIDFSALNFAYPTGMLVAGSKLRNWVYYRHQNGLKSRSDGISNSIQAHSYLSHVGFFDYIYMNEGNRIGQARGNINYLPITRIIRPEFNPCDQSLQDWYDSLQYEANKLAKVLIGSDKDEEAQKVYTYSIREIIRNAFEHSQAKECYICAQRWINGRVEIAVIDEGVGICTTLKESYELENDIIALETALRPGTSRTTKLSSGRNVFDNSGFGLYVLSKLAANVGWYALGSGEARIVGFGKAVYKDKFSFKGTFFGFKLFKRINNFSATLSEIISEGEKEAQLSGIQKRASGISKLIDL